MKPITLKEIAHIMYVYGCDQESAWKIRQSVYAELIAEQELYEGDYTDGDYDEHS